MTVASEQARAVIQRHSKSFALASRLLPQALRDDAVVLYAYCRAVDDAIDLAPSSEQGQALARLEAQLDAIYSGEVTKDPVLAAFADVVRRRRIPRRYPQELLLGMGMDVTQLRYVSHGDLLLYCYRVAGTVGLMMCHVLGVSSPKARRHAAHLGIGMQLTNICRDVAEDAGRGRIYLPLQLLEVHGIDGLPNDVGVWTATQRQAVAASTLDLLDLADLYYTSGDAGMRFLARPSASAVMLARLVYSDIGRVIRTRHADPCAGRAMVSAARKAWLAGQAWRRTRHLPALVVPQVLAPLGPEDAVRLDEGTTGNTA